MAKKPKKAAAPAKGKAASGKAGSGASMKVGLMLLGMMMVVFFIPTVIFLSLAMLPTLVAVVVDRSSERLAGLTVGGMNITGALPYLVGMWFGNHTVDNALNTLGSPITLMVVYGAAALGWALHLSTPAAISIWLAMTSGQRLQRLKSEQRDLLNKWGNEITGNNGQNKPGANEIEL